MEEGEEGVVQRMLELAGLLKDQPMLQNANGNSNKPFTDRVVQELALLE